MTILTQLTKPALKKQMRRLEKAILKSKREFLTNEVNERKYLFIYLVDRYQEIEATYDEFMRRYSYPPEVTIPSKMNADNEASKEPGYRWDLKGRN